MRVRLVAVLLAAVVSGYCGAGAAVKDNVVIESMTDVYRLLPTKDGNAVEKVQHESQMVFRANRVADTGQALAYYSDDVKIDKASGGSVVYGPFMGEDIFFSDSRGCLISVPLKGAGARGKASYKRTFTKPEFFCKVLLAEPYEVERAEITFEIPAGLESRYRIKELNIPADMMQVSEERKGNVVRKTYVFNDVKRYKVHSDAPSVNVTAPQLLILGHFADEHDVYRYVRGYTLDPDPDAGAVERMARELTADCVTEAAKIDAVNDFVHRSIRYVAVEHGELGHRPDAPSEVLRKRYGDCKGSAALMRALLRSAGVDARLAWVGTTSVESDWTDVPNVSSGNHMITAVMTGDSILYLDGTATNHPVGLVPQGIHGAQALIEDGDERCIVGRLPEMTSVESRRAEEVSMELGDGGDVKVSGRIMLSGLCHAAFASANDATLPGKRAELYNRVLSGVLAGCRSEDARYEAGERETVISGTGVVSGAVKNAGGEMYVDMNPVPELASGKFDMEERTVPGYYGGIRSQDYKVRLKVPAGYSAGSLPKDVTVDNDWISGSVSTTSTDGEVVRHVRIEVKRRDVATEHLTRFNADLQKMVRACNAKVVLAAE